MNIQSNYFLLFYLIFMVIFALTIFKKITSKPHYSRIWYFRQISQEGIEGVFLTHAPSSGGRSKHGNSLSKCKHFPKGV